MWKNNIMSPELNTYQTPPSVPLMFQYIVTPQWYKQHLSSSGFVWEHPHLDKHSQPDDPQSYLTFLTRIY